MPKARDLFNYDNEKYQPLMDASRAVVKAYQDANRFLDTTQEYVYIEQGMRYFSKMIHKQAHKYPVQFDKFTDMLHERHLMAEYPSTPELDWKEEFKDLGDVFALIIRVFDNIQEALEGFRNVTDNASFRAMALFVEELMLENSRDYTLFLEAWFRWDNDGGSKTSFDSWCEKLLDDLEDAEEGDDE